VFVLVRGDHQVDDGKLEAALGEASPADPEEVRKLTGAEVGFVSPVGIGGVTVIADPVLEGAAGIIAGANRNDYHYLGVEMGRDIKVDRYVPLRAVSPGDACTRCGNPLQVSRTIEVGHIFKLGTRYSEALGASFLDEAGVQRPIIMGSYGIGVERIMSCAVESLFDSKANSMVWPREIAPFLVEVLPINVTHDETRNLSESLYRSLTEKGVAVLLDDRDDRAGVKFKDSDLFGSPVVVVIGERNLKEGVVEIRVRDRGIADRVPVDEAEAFILRALEGE
jgi:prolyl-tRNA synthetase